MLQEYEAGRNPQKTVNLLRAVLWTRAAWESAVTKDIIKRCWVKSTLVKNPEDTATDELVEDSTEDCIDLRAQIAQLLIKNLLSLNKFLNLEDKTILNKEGDIFNAVVVAYSSNQADKEGESSDKEEEIK